ncbi:MAG: glycosyltransferase family 2 protein [Parcubacteria group bacterium]|nr:glycosyltransferase family 2 protein [Parcubacteria group bacterium]
MGKKYFVSIITPTYNHECYISSCINSVQRQTYKYWELIIIDDCSTDSTNQIITQFAHKDNRIKVIKHKKNWGINKLQETYNQALRLAKGDFIAILEGDDFWPHNKLEVQIKVFKDKKVVMSYGNWIMTDQNGLSIYLKHYKKFKKHFLNNIPVGSILFNFLTLHFDIGSQTVIFRKSALVKIGGFKSDKNYPFIDLPTYLSMSLVGEFAYINKTLGYYRRSAQSSWFNFAVKSKEMGRKEIKNCVNNFIKYKAKNIDKLVNWEEIEKKQSLYLFERRLTYFIRKRLNQSLFKKDLVSIFLKKIGLIKNKHQLTH